MFVYGAPNLEDRVGVWSKILTILASFPKCLVMGDFNQVELHSNKLGGSSNITGWDDFMQWRFASNLTEVPLSRPPFTWLNKREEGALILGRLDRVYMTGEWLTKFPDSRLMNQPILVSDHVAIVFETSTTKVKKNRPYHLENWCLSFTEIIYYYKSRLSGTLFRLFFNA